MSTHPGYITDQKFNSSIKNLLRDYYTYGFKGRSDYSVSDSTYNEDLKRLNDFLKGYMDWSELEKIEVDTATKKITKNRVTFTSCDSQSMSMNPFHRVYRFYGTDRPDYLYTFFHAVVALSGLFQLTDGVISLSSDENKADSLEKKLEVQDDQIIKAMKSTQIGPNVELQLEQYLYDKDKLIEEAIGLGVSDEQILGLREAIQSAVIKLKTSDLVKFYVNNALTENQAGSSINKTANNRLQRLSNIGVVCCSQKGGGRLFSDEQVEQVIDAVSDSVNRLFSGEDEKKILADIPDSVRRLFEKKDVEKKLKQSLKNYSPKKAGNRSWYLSKLTLERIIEAGHEADGHFDEHFEYCLDFYSKTFLFGEVGTFLLDRMGAGDDSPLRMKHEYYMHSLNDFNAIDLMTAIENKDWCLISYRRDKKETKLLCYPIELRISSINGREYLMYYEPFKKSCTALRLEFIESIQYYHDKDIKRCLSEYYPDREIEIEIDRNLSRAKLLMDYTWGVSTGAVQERNVEKLNAVFRELRVRIAYDKNSDYHVLRRLYRESRTGILYVNEDEGYIDFSVVAADIREAVPFIRGYYSRVISCTGFDGQGFSMDMDIKRIVGQMINIEEGQGWSDDNSVDKPWRIDGAFLELLGDGIKANAHDKLFNEVFSVYYHIFAAILSEICNRTQAYTGKEIYSKELSYTKKEIEDICKSGIDKFKDRCGVEMRWASFKEGKAFAAMLTDGGFLVEEVQNGELRYKPKYKTTSFVDLYREVIPLSEMEVRWLKTIINDGKIHYFLNEKEIMAVKLLLAEMAIDIRPFPMDVVNYYDRYKLSLKKEWKEGLALMPVLDAISKRHVVEINYISREQNISLKKYKPILVEYSKRDIRFRGYFLSYKKKEGIKILNLDQCISVADTGEGFDDKEVRACFDEYWKKQMDTVEIEFEDRQELADRILTELSPWKKSCELDSETGMFHLTIYYPKQDAREMAWRLLAFGANVRLTDPSHRIAVILKSKLRDQMDRMAKEVIRPAQGEKYQRQCEMTDQSL